LVEPSVTTYNQTEVNQTIQFEASRKGDDKDGRKYIVKILATDLAGIPHYSQKKLSCHMTKEIRNNFPDYPNYPKPKSYIKNQE